MTLRLGTLQQVAQPVADIDRAEAFYRDVLQLAPIARFPHLSFFDLDGVRLLLEAGDPDTNGSVLYLRVQDIQAAREELGARGVAFEHEPHVIHVDTDGTFGPVGHESWMAFFRDSEGNMLAISSIEPPRT
jgi:catechol 2,3-dioxygenase-like lactoylglutathione lyase family enzyme